VLKYDEVMNEQRKVIYALRLQVIDGEDSKSAPASCSTAPSSPRRVGVPERLPEDWELDRLLAEVQQYYPTKFVLEDLAEASSTEVLRESLLDEALAYYAEHSASLPGGKETPARSSAR